MTTPTPGGARASGGAAGVGAGVGAAGVGAAGVGAAGAMGADPAAVAERLLALVRGRSASAEAEVRVTTGVSALTRFANSFIHQNVAEEMSSVALRIALDGHVASAALDGPTTDESLARLVDGAFEAARVRPVDPDWPGPAEPDAPPAVDHWDDETAAAGPDERAQRVAAFVAAGDGLETAGYCSSGGLRVAFANTLGHAVAGRVTSAAVNGIARTSTSDGGAQAASVRLNALDGAALGAQAARRARESADPTDLEPGPYEVVLGPQAVANVLEFLGVYGFNGRAVEEGRSFVRLGRSQFDRSIRLLDDVTDPGQVGVAFDAEGTSRPPLELVLDGVTAAVLHNRRTARRAGPGVRSTGSAMPGGEGWGALPGNLVLAAGDRSDAELVSSVGRGVLVTDFHYTRVLDPRTIVVTGLTRNGAWLVEDGRIVRPVRNLRFTQSYVDGLGPDAVRGIGRDRTLISGDWDDGNALVPAVHLAAWQFTGNARG